MDYVRGRTLDRRLNPKKGEEKIALTRALEALRDVARAIHYAHEQGAIHRDLTPQNIIIDDQDHPHVLDFRLEKNAALSDLEHCLAKAPEGVLAGDARAKLDELKSGR